MSCIKNAIISMNYILQLNLESWRCERRGSATSSPELLRMGGVQPLPTSQCSLQHCGVGFCTLFFHTHTHAAAHEWETNSHVRSEIVLFKKSQLKLSYEQWLSPYRHIHLRVIVVTLNPIVPKLSPAEPHIHPGQLCVTDWNCVSYINHCIQ